MPRDGTATRGKILDAALGLIMDNGFGATSIDSVIEHAGITKGTFFYHFKNKQELALALGERFARQDFELLQEFSARAEKLTRDPLQQVLIFLGLFYEVFDKLDEVSPGCLFASFCYQSGLFAEEVNRISHRAILEWREYLCGKFKEIEKIYPPNIDVDYETLADFLTTTFEGAYVMSKILEEPRLIAKHLQHYRNYLELIFLPPDRRMRSSA